MHFLNTRKKHVSDREHNLITTSYTQKRTFEVEMTISSMKQINSYYLFLTVKVDKTCLIVFKTSTGNFITILKT